MFIHPYKSNTKMASAILNSVLLGLVTFLGRVESQKCILNMTSLELQPNFEFNRFMGRWFELSTWFHRVVNKDNKWDDHFRIITSRTLIMADYMTVGRPRNSTGACVKWSGHQLIAGPPSHPARLTWRIKTSRGTFADRALYVVSTDYVNYAITVECIMGATLNANGTCTPDPNVYVLGRKTSLEPDQYANVNNIIITRICHTDLQEFHPTFHQKQCPIPTAGASTVQWSRIYILLFLMANTMMTSTQ
ncbi:unnamed protein product [Owenia fusiformis]|uniref:Uncharacterized protein n=1 Tax=Owenia fusiformis TaxID=6347 RepID=A0A8J1TDE9_OWEFU|nr:unnamed protein product [Owenia fusiformis]